MRIRIFLAAAVAGVGAVALAGAAFAAGGFGSPGTTVQHDLSASAALNDNTTNLYLSVDRGVTKFLPIGGGQLVVTGPQTVLNYSGTKLDGSVIGGCFMIPDSRFKVATNLASALLVVDPSVESPCPGTPVPAIGRPGIVGFAGGGGGGGVPITAKLLWTSNGALIYSTFSGNVKCQSSVSKSTGVSTSTYTTLSGSVSLLTALNAQFSNITDTTSTDYVSAPLSNACLGI